MREWDLKIFYFSNLLCPKWPLNSFTVSPSIQIHPFVQLQPSSPSNLIPKVTSSEKPLSHLNNCLPTLCSDSILHSPIMALASLSYNCLIIHKVLLDTHKHLQIHFPAPQKQNPYVVFKKGLLDGWLSVTYRNSIIRVKHIWNRQVGKTQILYHHIILNINSYDAMLHNNTILYSKIK